MKSIDQRIRRLRAGGKPRVLDLFSGCGGISLGLDRAGFETVAGLDHDRGAMETWYFNHRPDLLSRLHGAPSWDVRTIEPAKFFADLGMAGFEDSIDVVCGGPPCQAYSRIGKSKLQSLGGEGAHLWDERGSLYQEFLRFVKVIMPLAVIVENVPDSVNYGGDNIPKRICGRLRRLGYRASWTLLNAVEYGVPQYRQRVFILAVHESVGRDLVVPEPTHCMQRSSDGRGFNDNAANYLQMARQGPKSHYLPPSEPACGLPTAIGTEAALDDLPRIRPLSLPAGMKLCVDVRTLAQYASSRPKTDYQRLMRSWSGLETDGWVTGNALRNTPRDFAIFREMMEGDHYPEALTIANWMLERKVVAAKVRLGRDLSKKEHATLRKATVPPYDAGKFETKWTKLRRDRPSHTVVAHLQYDTYSHIHYDEDQARAITVREAARLQSIPDGFRFLGSMTDAFKQIGNAVPPLLAHAVGVAMLRCLGVGESALDRSTAVNQRTPRAASNGR